ncbi:putative DNA damage repair protein Mus42 [Aspergillus candidus]|uniref:DNA repair protein REV1 n=1 Tax=Aspergillus candidus TaxID=41067 RepID=A0A2I2FG11_ASPCN|nr:putative DNA damage repair protein Mus42 [Aspergillus candidus]PLB39576.1 putative DNA damage repair protein Mus42 [Aspergillus candidus]
MGSLLDEKSNSVRKRIENHVFEDEVGEEYEASAFGGFGDYMRRKKIKLQNLDAEIRSSSGDCLPIFRGVVVHVNGYTQPSLQDLHRMVVSHGGGFLQYLDGKTSATHIVASSLTPKKREEFRRYRIVKPAWVVESIKAKRLLPWDAFRVVDEGQTQKVLKFDNGRVLNESNTPQSSYRDQTNSSWYTSQLRESAQVQYGQPSSGVSDMSPTADQPVNPPTQSDYGDFPSFTSLDEPNESNKVARSGAESVEERATTPVPISHAPEATHSPLKSPPAVTNVSSPSRRHAPAPEVTSEEYNAQLLSDPRMRNNSVVNPEFIQQYYRESRLHHLSTWKAELKAQLQLAAKEKSQSPLSRRRQIPGARRYIMHVDFDCFFAAVAVLKHPDLEGKPVAVAHGTGSGSEIASCNYTARAKGVKNGMWMKGALQSCPDLNVLPYDFPAYEDASRKFYSAILSVDGIVQSVSIDEALVDITGQCLEAGGSDGRGVSEGSIYREQAKADEIADSLRHAVKLEAGCSVSMGIGGNILQAKVALRKAKPAGQFQLKPDMVLDFIGNLTVQDLPGVGYSLGAKLEELGIKFVKDVRDQSKERLTSALGPKTGAKIWEYARGIDRTEVGNEVMRKSVSAEVNWGIRFVNQTQAEDFVRSLCEELHRRLVENLVKGKQLTLKVMRRSADAPLEPVKHLGHGKCDTFNKSVLLGVPSNSTDVLGKEAVSMLKSFAISPGDLRGIGVQMTKLEPLKPATGGSIEASQKQLNFKASPARKRAQQAHDPDDLESPRKEETDTVNYGPSLNDSNQKPLNISGTQFIMPSQTDPQVVAELPNDIRSKLVAQGKQASRRGRSTSPCPPPRRNQPPVAAELPPQSQLDPETLAALPEDVRAEVLGYYNQQGPSDPQAAPAPAAPTSPATVPAPPNPLRFKKPTSPPKKKRGRPSTKSTGSTTLRQANFLFPRPTTPTLSEERGEPSPLPDPADEVSPEFLAALPEDIRREVLEEHRRARTRSRPGSATQRTTGQQTRPFGAPPAPAQERRLRLPPLPERPTFTSQKLSRLSDLRDAIGSWHAAFAEEGPFEEDVEALAYYVKRVVVDERDLDKAVSVTKWLMWLVEDSRPTGAGGERGSPNGLSWDEAVRSLQRSVAEGVEERGLPPVDFS